MTSRPVRRAAWLLPILATSALLLGGATPKSSAVVPLTIDAGHVVAMFTPDEAFGVAFDGGDHGESKPLLSPANRAALAAVGVPRGTYRLRTELAIEAWHWSAFGSWSDPAKQQGYWTGDPSRDDPSPVSFGYRLPRRGDTLDEADNDGFSRLDDGDSKTFWKSNPYLDPRHTGGAEHAEWVKIDLGAETPVDTVEIDWAEPFARRFRVQHWVAQNDWSGRWVDFPTGRIDQGVGGMARIRLASGPMPVRFVRLLLTESSHTAAPGATDPRDRLGYAIGEVRLGHAGRGGVLIDAVRHGAENTRQSLIVVSSTDPWHRAEDINRNTEQPSPLAIVKAGLVGAGPMMLPVGLLYDTPDNALAELAYFERRGLKLGQIELGEEPDGQRVLPEDYGALYVPLARAIHRRWPGLVLGGPSLVNVWADTWMDDSGEQSFTKRLLAYLKGRGAEDELGFFSTEYYPFENFCGPVSAQLAEDPQKMTALFRRLHTDGLPAKTPVVISEYGPSAFAARLEVELPGALFTVQMAADFLSKGGTTAYLYGFAPNRPLTEKRPCSGLGNMMLWEADEADKARWAMPSFYGWRLLTQEWVKPGGGAHAVVQAVAAPANVGVYAVHRPDGRWAVLLLNRGDKPVSIAPHFVNGGPAPGAVERLSYSAAQYRWSSALQHPTLDRPPRRALQKSWGEPITLPPISLTLLRSSQPG